MPETAQFQTGNELTANRGDAALGYSSGVQYNANPAVENPLAGFDNTIGRLQQQEYQIQAQKHLERREDLEKMSQMLAQTGGSAFNMKDAHGNNISFTPLPEDKKYLDAQADKLRELVLKNPEKYKYDPEVIKTQRELDYATRHASTRAAFHTMAQQEAAKEQDDAERAAILKNAEEQTAIPITEYKQPVPHMAGAKFVDELADWHKDKKNWQTISTKLLNDNGADYEETKTAIPVNKIYEPLLNAGKLKDSRLAQALWLKTPDANNPNFVYQMNQTIDRNAAALGTQPVHAAEVLPNGQVIQNPDPRAVLVAHNLATHGAVETTRKESKLSMEKQKQNADIADMKEKARLARLKYDLDKSKENRLAKDDADETLGAAEAVHQVVNEFTERRNSSTWKDANIVPLTETKDKALYNAIKKNTGFDPKGFSAIDMPKTSISKEMMGEPSITTNGKGEKTMTGQREASKQFYLKNDNGNVHDDMIAYQYTGEDGKDKWKLVRVPEAIQNKVSSMYGYKENAKEQPIAKAAKYYNDYRGGTAPAKQQPQQDSEEAIKARWQPITFKNGKKGYLDPVTQKRYAAE